MNGVLATAGELVDVHSSLRWASDLISEGACGELGGHELAPPTMSVVVEADRGAFPIANWEPLMRGAWRFGREVVIQNVCSSGFDMLVRPSPPRPEFIFRWRPSAKSRAVTVLRSRFRLLARAVLLQYPAMWQAGSQGRVPLHGSVLTNGTVTPLVVGPGGSGKSTLLFREIESGGRATSDNLCVTDGTSAWGVVEPLRVEGGSGRRMPHGRRERPLYGRLAELLPDHVVVLRRAEADVSEVRPYDPDLAARVLIGGTYMAGELRRYWSFAATLAAGTGLGPAHPAVCQVSQALCENLPCVEASIALRDQTSMSQLLGAAREAASSAPEDGPLATALGETR